MTMKFSQFAHNLYCFVVKVIEWKYSIPMKRYDSLLDKVLYTLCPHACPINLTVTDGMVNSLY